MVAAPGLRRLTRQVLINLVITYLFVVLSIWGGEAVADVPQSTGTGLLGAYYDSNDLSAPKLVRTDPKIDFNWGAGSPSVLVPADHFEVLWSGFLEPLYSEDHTFTLWSDNGCHVWLNGELILDQDGPTGRFAVVSLVAGQKYPIRIEYGESVGLAEVHLWWESASQPKVIIPQSQLYPPSYLVGMYYVNDISFYAQAEPGSICIAPGNDSNDGLTPATPMRAIQGLLNKHPTAGTGKTLRIDPGTYAENVTVAPAHSGLKILGAGADRTVVDGGQTNTVFVLTSFGAGELSGLTIQNGKAAGATALEKSGGGIRINGTSTALIANCIVRNNAAGSGSGGGGIYTYNASPTIKNCVVVNNAGTGCGGIRTYNGAVTITNCTVANNTGGGIHKTGTGTLGITNSIAWANGDDLISCTATYSCIEDADAGTGNTAADPLFINAAGGDYRLLGGSPCIDTADTATAPATDLLGNARRDDTTLPPNGSAYADMGAYEFMGDTQNGIVYVNDAAFNEAGSLCGAPGNDANSGFSPRGPMRTIQGALNKYPNFGAGKTIWVDPGTYPENVTVAATHAGLKILGAGADRTFVDGGKLNSVFVLSNFGAGELSGLTLQNGLATGATAVEKSGGGIRISGASTALIANCVIKNNAAGSGSGGGGIYTYNASPSIRNCVIANNTGTTCGGIRTYGADVTVTNCTVANNTGGIQRLGTGGLTITNCIVWGNGDDLISCAATYSDIEDGDAGTGNVSGDPRFLNGGTGDYRLSVGSAAIDVADTAAAPATDILGNSRHDDPGTLPNGSAYADMGAYEFQGTTVPAVLYVNDDSTAGDLFCTAVGDDLNDGWTPATPMRHIQSLLNKYPAIGARTVKVDTGLYAENIVMTATHAGWKLHGAGADRTVLDGGRINSVVRLTAQGNGGISGFTIQNGMARGATALEKSGGGIRCYSGSNPLITNCVIRNNAAETGSGGGGIYTYLASPTITNCMVYGNAGTGNGGIRTYGGAVTITNCTVVNNTASGIHRTGTGTLAITNCIVWENGDDLLGCTATYSCIQDGDAGTGNISVSPQFVNAAWANYHLKPTSPCIDAANSGVAPVADLDGNARRDEPSVPNTGVGTPPADMGAFEFNTLVYSDLFVNDAILGEVGSRCTAPGSDANDGLSPETPKRSIQNALNTYPSAGVGKVMWIDPGLYPETVNVAATHSGLKIRGSSAPRTVIDGGQANSVIVLTDFGAGELSGLTLQNGKATGATALEKSGGGIRITGASTALIANCIIRNNAAGSGSGGGGIYTYLSSPTIQNCIVDHNVGTGNGGIRTYGGVVKIINCTVADNGVSGIHKTGTGTLAITNCIVWANGDDLSSCTATYSCIEDGDAGTGNISGNPLFVNAVAGDYHLTFGSPCIDAGTATGAPTTDLDGVARDATPDIGAYEYDS